MALVLYVIWLVGTMGNIPRPAFIDIAEKGGNIDVLVQTLSGLLSSSTLDLLLTVFSNFAVASSFLGVTLGLFDYLAHARRPDLAKRVYLRHRLRRAGSDGMGGHCAGTAGARLTAAFRQPALPGVGRQRDDCADPVVRRG